MSGFELFIRPQRTPPLVHPLGLGFTSASRVGLCRDVREMLPPDCKAVLLLYDRRNRVIAIEPCGLDHPKARKLYASRTYFTAPGFLLWAELQGGFYVDPVKRMDGGKIGGKVPDWVGKEK